MSSSANAIRECFADAVRGGTGVARLLRGGRAQGKTTSLRRISEQLAPVAEVFEVAASPDESRQPYALLQQLVPQLCASPPAALQAVLDGPDPDGADSDGADPDGAASDGTGPVEAESGPEHADVCRQLWRVLRERVAQRPVALLVDDVDQVDARSARALAFSARRAGGRALAMIMTAGTAEALHDELARIPAEHLGNVDEARARELLGERGAEAAEHVLTELVQLCAGNPLVLAECAEALGDPQLTGREPLPRRPVLGARSLQVFSAPWRELPEAARQWLLVLALGPPTLPRCVRAARCLGLELDDLAPAERAGVVRTRGGSEQHWPSTPVREAVIQSATLAERARACEALAEQTPADSDPAEHARYLAGALVDPDRAASALAGACVPMARAGRLLEAYEAISRARSLTTDTAERERYRTIAAELAWLAGYGEHALDVLDEPSAPRSADARTSALIMQAVIHGFKDSWSAAWRLLPLDGEHVPGSAGHAVRLLITALTAGWETVPREALQETVHRLRDLMEAGVELVPGVVETVERVVAGDGDPAPEQRRTLLDLTWWAQPSDALHPKAWPPRLLPVFLGEEDTYARAFSRLLRTEHVQAARSTRALLLLKLATAQSASGQWGSAADNASRGASLAEELGHHALRSEALLALAWIDAARGDEQSCDRNLDAANGDGQDRGPSVRQWARGLVALSNGRPSEAFERLRELHHDTVVTPQHLVLQRLSTMDTVEAAVLADRRQDVAELVAEFADWVERGAADWARADLARCRALLDDDNAEQWYQLALERSAESGRMLPTARTRLQYGSWLRRRRRHQDARAHLRHAEEGFESLGAGSWRERAHAELRATGETRTGRGNAGDELTPQEREIAKLAASGHTNRQIANKLSLSPRTVGYHLYKVFPKLDITSRAQLASALDSSPGEL